MIYITTFVLSRNHIIVNDMPIRLIHFSDLHLSLMDDENVINLVHEMTQTLLKLSVQHSIDLIIFTGDMIDRGGKNFQTISEAFECFKKNCNGPYLRKIVYTFHSFYYYSR